MGFYNIDRMVSSNDLAPPKTVKSCLKIYSLSILLKTNYFFNFNTKVAKAIANIITSNMIDKVS